jgi:hypothetical protein
MAQYRVSFFNNLVNSNGKPFKCCQRKIIVDDANDAGAASDKATREFEHLEGVSNWKSHAQFFEVEIVETAGKARHALTLLPHG